MDAVDACNHLIPSDQLHETLAAGQNMDCEGGNDLGSVLPLEESLKNMLSDKDPMFGCASSQFNLLENESPAVPSADSTGLTDGSASKEGSSEPSGATPVKRPVGRPRKRPTNVEPEHSSSSPPPTNRCLNPSGRGRPGRKPMHRLQRSFLIEEGIAGADLKKELSLGGRVNVNNLNAGSWMNPSVVLRRLTVTIGGFKIELLPGPSYSETVEVGQSAYLDSVTCGPDVGFNVLSDDNITIQNVAAAIATVAPERSSDDSALAPGPYVNPNDVQSSNGTAAESLSVRTKPNSDSSPSVETKADVKANEDKQAQSDEKNVSNKTDGKLKAVKSPLKAAKGKDLVTSEPNNTVKRQKETANVPSAAIQREDLHKMKVLKEKKDISTLKRPVENIHTEPAAKVQKVQKLGDDKAKPKLPSSPTPLAKKTHSLGSRPDQPSPAKHVSPHNSTKAENAAATHTRPLQATKAVDEGGQEKLKVKKLEKILQKQRSKSSRSISVEEPQLFVPDNAPVAKKESSEEQPANSETAWDGNNCCGLCKKHHNNMFMVGCGRCDDWFHGDCVGLDLAKVREMEEEDQMYVCLKCCEEESKRAEPEAPCAAKPEAPATTEVQDSKQPQKPRPGPSQAPPPGGGKPVKKDPDRRHSADTFYKTVSHPKQEKKSKLPPSASKKPVSVESIRRSVRDSLKEILTQRLKESDLKVSVEKALEVAKKTERELFHMYKDTDNKYKNKYRSLMFNLKDTKNNVLFKKVLKGDISPGNLIRMSPEELASKELAAWRKRENRHTIEMIEKEQREVERRPITKITHKGEIEIESQEPVKAPEPVELEPPPKVAQVPAEPPKTPEKKEEKIKAEKDTTSLHKSHLFDLHCKICTGRMVAPVEEAPTKVVKVATTVARRPSAKSEETKGSTPAAMDDELHLTALEESFRSTQSGYEGRTDFTTGRDEEANFLSSLKSLWRGFIHMHAVAKLVTKAFPVSGIMDNMTEDLPDSVQVGGRISPQIVWDYLEKIRATGTKEVCLIRFTPETEEDEISYTLLYAYFSSRKRFGVVSNNRKQVKDMYLIPLGASEKVPHQLVPFDGPGLENNRSNLLLGLIIRQKPKRDFLPVDVNESARIVPETKPVAVPAKDARATEEDEKLFISSLTALRDRDKEKQAAAAAVEDAAEPSADAFEEPAASESGALESQRPLRFLPGVLVGWGGELPPLPDFSGKPAPPAEDSGKTQPVPSTEAPSGDAKSPTAAAAAAGSRERFIIKKKESKTVKAEPELPAPPSANLAANSSSVKDAAGSHGASVSLKDKPPDVSTEAFLESLTAAPGGAGTDTSPDGSASQPDKGMSEGNQSKPADAPANSNSSKPPLSGILKKSSAYPPTTSTTTASPDKPAALQKDSGVRPPPASPKVSPAASGSAAVTTFHQGLLQISQARNQTEELNRTTTIPSGGKKDDAGAAPTASPLTAETSDPQHNSVPGPLGAAPVHSQALEPQPQPPDSYHLLDQNHRAQHGAAPAPPAAERPSPLAKDYRPAEERYTDPWERPRNAEHRDHHGRHGHHRDSHHGKKSRHHDREREKRHERSCDEKGKERSRHHGHSDDRYGEKRKDHGSRHKERHRHRRDSDYENGRRSSRDSYS